MIKTKYDVGDQFTHMHTDEVFTIDAIHGINGDMYEGTITTDKGSLYGACFIKENIESQFRETTPTKTIKGTEMQYDLSTLINYRRDSLVDALRIATDRKEAAQKELITANDQYKQIKAELELVIETIGFVKETVYSKGFDEALLTPKQ